MSEVPSPSKSDLLFYALLILGGAALLGIVNYATCALAVRFDSIAQAVEAVSP